MKRIPVTKESIEQKRGEPYMSKLNSGKSTAGTKRVSAEKTKVAAGLGSVNFGWNLNTGFGGLNTSAYNTSYANMGQATGAFGDVPLYFAIMNQNNGGILYWPVTLKEKYSWYRYFARVDPYVKRAVEFHTDLPMSKLILRMPKMKNKAMREQILRKYESMIKRIKLFDRLHSMLYEANVIGNAYVFCEFDEDKKEWGKLVILPPEEILVSKYPMSDTSKILYRPELINHVLHRYTVPIDDYEAYKAFVEGLPDDEREVMINIPFDLTKQLVENDGALMMDTSPFSGDDGHTVGSFVYHFSEKRHDYYDLGVSPLECVLIPLLMKEHYKYTQLSLASRNLTPRNKITAPEISESALQELREQVDMSMLDPDYSIVTNYDWNWEQIGAENRLLDMSRENEWLDEQFFSGLGVTKELLTGESMYSGSKISVELLNTRYLLRREMLQQFVEESLFLPVAEENGFYEIDNWGSKTYFYPKLSFTRLTIRDNSEVFDSLFQLYQKGSLPVDVILDLFNLDADEVDEQLKRDMFHIKDSTYNEFIRGIYGDLGSKVVEETDLVERMIATLNGPDGKPLKHVEPKDDEDDGSGGEDDDGSFGNFGGLENLGNFGQKQNEDNNEAEKPDNIPDESTSEESESESKSESVTQTTEKDNSNSNTKEEEADPKTNSFLEVFNDIQKKENKTARLKRLSSLLGNPTTRMRNNGLAQRQASRKANSDTSDDIHKMFE